MARALSFAARKALPAAEPDQTSLWYDREAEAYFRSTVDNDLEPLWSRFLDHVPPGGTILDAGSGSGRDTRLFQSRGYEVDAFDASPALAKLSSAHTSQLTEVATFSSWSGPSAFYDGVWAFASLLHVPRRKLGDAIEKLVRSLKPGAYLFASFKGGAHDTIDPRGRRFTNLSPAAAEQVFQQNGRLDRIEVWSEEAPAAHGEVTTWVYVLARRAGRSSPAVEH
jgi:SAM-dependent methyltransferase